MGKIHLCFEWDGPAMGRPVGQEALPRLLTPPKPSPWASTPGCPSWLGLHAPGRELGSTSLAVMGDRECEQPPTPPFLPTPHPYLGECRTQRPSPGSISTTLRRPELRGALQQTWVEWGMGGTLLSPTPYCCLAHSGPRYGAFQLQVNLTFC